MSDTLSGDGQVQLQKLIQKARADCTGQLVKAAKEGRIQAAHAMVSNLEHIMWMGRQLSAPCPPETLHGYAQGIGAAMERTSIVARKLRESLTPPDSAAWVL